MSVFFIAVLLGFAPSAICLIAILVIWDSKVEHLARAYDKEYRDRDALRNCSWRYGMREINAFPEKFFDAYDVYRRLPMHLKGKRDWAPILEGLGKLFLILFVLAWICFYFAARYL